ncbi:MAG: GNAT family N-acetyltransferase [Flavobacteriales bacterium]|nr:GNAT family N-acetyltransferase [Flavobacteriales bacterium]MCC6936960.1 GNAT family N-acetyltransferase [Flavobacteriales bacterium]
MIIKECTADELGVIHDIAHRTWPVVYASILSTDQLAYMLDRMYSIPVLHEQLRQGHQFFICTKDDRPIGFAGFEHHYGTSRSTRLHKLYVLPELHGSGAGYALLNAVIEAAKNAGDTAIELNVNRFNLARHWYQRQGFRILRNEVIDIGQGYVMDDHVMELSF